MLSNLSDFFKISSTSSKLNPNFKSHIPILGLISTMPPELFVTAVETYNPRRAGVMSLASKLDQAPDRIVIIVSRAGYV